MRGPVRLVVGFSAGGPTDITARVIGSGCRSWLSRQFIVENRPGAGSIAAELAAKAPPDGYTLVLVTDEKIIRYIVH